MKFGSANHLFEGEFTNRNWTHYYQNMGIPISGDGISTKLQSWWTQASPDNAMGIIKLILPCILCWEIWKEQNRRGLSLPVELGSLPQWPIPYQYQWKESYEQVSHGLLLEEQANVQSNQIMFIETLSNIGETVAQIELSEKTE
ncbi:hypothetical protein CK203_109317 [Vitis vinifera]|uniref:Uncharacterized protein n=1 Tax=Vitis vinifera TaxID=29760 RepID=A0A438C4T0_VITVI|nr:hypothetical protein CK203_109317 [Vitis vinifera]